MVEAVTAKFVTRSATLTSEYHYATLGVALDGKKSYSPKAQQDMRFFLNRMLGRPQHRANKVHIEHTRAC